MEAHPVDAWTDDDNGKAKIVVASARSEAERCATAETCVTELSVQIPPVIDDLNNSTEIAYTGWTDRLYVIDAEGRVAYKSKPGPYGFKPGEVETALKRLVPAPPAKIGKLNTGTGASAASRWLPVALRFPNARAKRATVGVHRGRGGKRLNTHIAAIQKNRTAHGKKERLDLGLFVFAGFRCRRHERRVIESGDMVGNFSG